MTKFLCPLNESVSWIERPQKRLRPVPLYMGKKDNKKKDSGLRKSAKYTSNGDDLVSAPHNQPHPHPNPHPLPSWVTCLRSSSRILSTINKTINTIVWISCSIRDEISDVTNTRACVYFPVQVVFFAQFSLCVNVYIKNMIIKRRVWSD